MAKSDLAGWNTKQTNTFFVNGGEDPWRWASLQSSITPLNVISRVADCNNCGHCVELYNIKDDDPPEVKAIRDEIMLWIANILSKSKSDITTQDAFLS